MAGLALLILVLLGSDPTRETLVRYFFYRQDMPLALAMVAVFAGFALWTGGAGDISLGWPCWAKPMAVRVALLSTFIVLVGYVGHWFVMSGYAFSRDEQMVLHDADIFRRGEIVARLPDAWRDHAMALNTLFMPEAVKGYGAISIYRPGNAVAHALVGLVADPAWTNPLLSAIGLFATWRVARRITPDDRESQFVAVLLFATSTQVLALSMTSYAMTGRLALGMVWLAFFLRNTWPGHLAALVLAFVAIGWQQPVYFPVFAGPFLFFLLVMKRRWAWSAAYAIVFAASLLFWMRYSVFAIRELGVPPRPSDVEAFFLIRMWWALSSISPAYLWTQSAYLVRFLVWDHILLLPLFIAGFGVALKRREPVLLALIGSIVALIVMKTILRPYQGHGWGYRYIHGLVGIICIVAAMGWRELRSRGILGQKHLAAGTAITMFVFAPILLTQAHHLVERFARIDRAIAASGADIVIVDDAVPEFTQDLVYNPPYLDRRPVRLLATRLEPGDIAGLCARGSIGFVGAPQLEGISRELGLTIDRAKLALPALVAAAGSADCRVVAVGVHH